MAIEAVATDVAITWIGAAGCGLFAWHLAGRDDRSELKATRFLIAVLTALLFVRGFAWWLDHAWLDRLVLTIAALLPLAITLFCERMLRRHHPAWLKVLALTTTVAFVTVNIAVGVTGKSWLLAFMTMFAVVVAANGGFLLATRRAQLGAEEIRLARALVVVALVSVPLLLSDFRTLHAQVPVRMGALGAMLFVYVMLAAAAGQSVTRLPLRLLGWLATAVAIAAVFALIDGGGRQMQFEQFWRGIPVACAWLLLMAIFGLSRSASATHQANDFIRWLANAPVTSLDAFVAALATYTPLQGCVILRGSDLSDYDLTKLWRACASDEPVALAWARASAGARSGDTAMAESAEQWLDLFERHQMTHALPVSTIRPLVVLLNLPVAAPGSVAHLRAAVLLRIARRLDTP
jgi:hypothetical protein